MVRLNLKLLYIISLIGTMLICDIIYCLTNTQDLCKILLFHKSNTTCATSGAGTACLSKTHLLIHVYKWTSSCSIFSFLWSILSIIVSVFVPLSFGGHSIVCHSNYDFWLTLCCLQHFHVTHLWKTKWCLCLLNKKEIYPNLNKTQKLGNAFLTGLTLQSFVCERFWRRLYQTRVVRTKFQIHVLISECATVACIWVVLWSSSRYALYICFLTHKFISYW
jgi:hypothetical protein